MIELLKYLLAIFLLIIYVYSMTILVIKMWKQIRKAIRENER